MKKSIEKIYTKFPMLSAHLNDSDTIAKKELAKEEYVFLKMIKFFNETEESFDVALLKENLERDWLAFALDVLNTYFKEDTYLMPEDQSMTIYEHDPLLNQTAFAQFLSDNGLNFDRRKFSTYRGRGLMPYPDVTIAGIPYWKTSTAKDYLNDKTDNEAEK